MFRRLIVIELALIRVIFEHICNVLCDSGACVKLTRLSVVEVLFDSHG